MTTIINEMMRPMHQAKLWELPLYLELLPEIDPFQHAELFRSPTQAYDGQQTLHTLPSPEPDLPDEFWRMVIKQYQDETLIQAATTLATTLAQWEPQFEKLVFIAILRAGVPIADWLTRLLPGSQAVIMGMFVGTGVDQVALAKIQTAYPEHRFVFVDGWTGRGGVARELAQLALAPLAALIDPWGWADFRGYATDLFCPTACFTGPTTLGFSRAFVTSPQTMFSAYQFPEPYLRPELVHQWQTTCRPQSHVLQVSGNRFFKSTTLRLHSNEVCRALINAHPETIYFLESSQAVQNLYPLLLMLAELRHVPVEFNALWLQEYQTKVACSLHRSEG